jgi:class 3 adenylate cyclase
MTLKDELQVYVANVFAEQWVKREGQKVPEAQDLALANEGVLLSAAVLYADLAESTAMVAQNKGPFAAEVYKSYLYCAAKVIRAQGGAVTAYDGDRVMGVFIGDNKATGAGKAALNIAWSLKNVIQPALDRQYPNSGFVVQQKVGVDVSSLLVARTGIRGTNDLVWVGTAANNAAKMAALGLGYTSYITSLRYESLNREAKYGAAGEPMWTDLGSSALGYQIYGSNWTWSL